MDKDPGQIARQDKLEASPRRGLSPLAAVGGIVVVAALAGGGIWFALQNAAPKPLPIGTVTSDLRTYDGQIVTVKGHVDSATNLIFAKTFELSDDSGTITVVTERGLPAEGSEVTVTGQVNQAFKIGSFEKTVLMEPAETEN